MPLQSKITVELHIHDLLQATPGVYGTPKFKHTKYSKFQWTTTALTASLDTNFRTNILEHRFNKRNHRSSNSSHYSAVISSDFLIIAMFKFHLIFLIYIALELYLTGFYLLHSLDSSLKS